MQLKQSNDGISHNSSWIAELYQRDADLVEMTTKSGRTYYVRTEFPAQLDEWFAAESKGQWFLRNQDRLTIVPEIS